MWLVWNNLFLSVNIIYNSIMFDILIWFLSNRESFLLQHPDDYVHVEVLETADERAILDPDDVVSDVLDDRDKVMFLLHVCEIYLKIVPGFRTKLFPYSMLMLYIWWRFHGRVSWAPLVGCPSIVIEAGLK